MASKRGMTLSIGGFVAGLVLATVLFEGGMRLIEATPLWKVLPVSEASFYGPDPLAGYTLRPGAEGIWTTENRARHRVNSLGMLDSEVTAKGIATRIAVMGDSYTEALQVQRPETFVRQAQAILRDGGIDAEVLNFGLSGATPAVMAARLESTALQTEPDIAVFVISVGDFLGQGIPDNSEFAAYMPAGGSPAGEIHRRTGFTETRGYQFRTSPTGRFIYDVLDHSKAATALNNRKNVGLLAELSFAMASARPDGAARTDVCRGKRMGEILSLLEEEETALRKRMIDAFRRDLTGLVSGRGIDGVIALRGLDTGCPEDLADRRRAVAAFGELMAPFSVVDFDALVAERLPAGATMKDLSGFGAARGQGHLNATGHAVYGNALADMLRPIVLKN